MRIKLYTLQYLQSSTLNALANAEMQEQTFTHELSSLEEFQLNRHTWQQLGGVNGSGKLGKNWCHVFADGLKESNPYCSFAFKRHWVKRSMKKASMYAFKAWAHCTSKGCPVQCILLIKSNQVQCDSSDSTIAVTVNYEGNVKHERYCRQARHISGAKRDTTTELASRYPPTYLRHHALAALPPDVFASGNRDGIGRSKHVLQKIASEGRNILRLDSDMIKSLQILRHTLIKEDTYGQALKGYIQEISVVPFRVVCFTEGGVRLYHDLAKKFPIHCDATGTIVGSVQTSGLCPEETTKLLYYAIVVQHPKKGEPPLAVAEMVSAEHSVLAVRQFIGRFRRAESLLFDYHPITPKFVVIDRSLVLLQAFLMEVNGERVIDFLARSFRIVQGKGTGRDLELMNPHACCSHVMKSARNDFKNKYAQLTLH